MKEPKKYKLKTTEPPIVSDQDAPTYQRSEKPLTFDDVWRMFQETDKKFQETDKQFKETDKQFKETARRINKLDNLFTTQWGKLMESLVEGDLLPLLRAKGINVHRTFQRIKDDERFRRYEFDIVAENSDEAVFVEVKTTLRPDDVSDFLEKLTKVKTWMPKYHDTTIYGAVAYLTADSNSHVMAEKRGLFVIRATGSSASIINGKGFVPKEF